MLVKKSQPPSGLVVRSIGEREDHDEGSEGPEWAIRGRASSLSRRATGLSHRRAPDKPYAKVPWHYHNNVHDTFYVLEGTIRVFLQRPKEEVRLSRGQTFSVPPKRPHLVTNAGETSAVFLVLQGIGDYDFVPLT